MSVTGQQSDENLLNLLKNGHKAAFEELYNRYWDKLYSCAYKRLKLKEIAEEIVQDFFVSIWCNRATLNIHTSFSIYAQFSIRFLVFGQYRKDYLRKKYASSMPVHIVAENTTEDLIAIKDLKNIVKDRVKILPEKCRSVYELSRDEYKNNKEIASLLGISEKTVENHLTRALKNIKVSVKNMTSV